MGTHLNMQSAQLPFICPSCGPAKIFSLKAILSNMGQVNNTWEVNANNREELWTKSSFATKEV